MSLENTLKITFRHQNLTPAVSAHIKNLFQKCHRLYERIIHCSVTISQEHCSDHAELLHCVHIRTEIPRHTVIAKDHTHTNMYTALGDAFDSIKKQLDEINTKMHATHADEYPILKGVVRKISQKNLYGFIEDSNGDSLYFSSNSVTKKGFNRLKVGQEVHYTQLSTQQGEQARKVKVIKRH